MGHGSLAGTVDLFCGGLSFCRRAAVDYDAAAFGEKSPRHLLADARVSTCDDRNFPFKPHVALLDTLGDFVPQLSMDPDLLCYWHGRPSPLAAVTVRREETPDRSGSALRPPHLRPRKRQLV